MNHMTLRPSPQIEAELLSKGPGDFYALASTKHQTAIVHGKDETVVGIGTAKLIMVPNGLRSLDPYDKTYYDPSLAATIANQHLVLATVPFDPHAPFAVVVPEIAVQFTSEQEIIISSHSSNNDKTQALLWEILEQSYADCGLLHLSRLQYLQTDQDFERRVAEAIKTISTSEITKIVLSKTATLESIAPLTPSQLYSQMAAKYPDSYLFAMGNWVGASPELVITLNGNSLTSHPLAGTAMVTDASELLMSQKDRTEHQIVVTQIIDRLSKLKINLKKQPTPTITNYGQIAHLGSDISGTLIPGLQPTSIELAARIAPTAAICGEPLDLALGYIKNDEYPGRDIYGGLVGYQKFQGDGCWVLNIRAIELTDRGAAIRAGVGIISESNPGKENAEANSKISSILDGITPSSAN